MLQGFLRHCLQPEVLTSSSLLMLGHWVTLRFSWQLKRPLEGCEVESISSTAAQQHSRQQSSRVARPTLRHTREMKHISSLHLPGLLNTKQQYKSRTTDCPLGCVIDVSQCLISGLGLSLGGTLTVLSVRLITLHPLEAAQGALSHPLSSHLSSRSSRIINELNSPVSS